MYSDKTHPDYIYVPYPRSGNLVIIKHESDVMIPYIEHDSTGDTYSETNTYYSYYAHLYEIAPDLEVGQCKDMDRYKGEIPAGGNHACPLGLNFDLRSWERIFRSSPNHFCLPGKNSGKGLFSTATRYQKRNIMTGSNKV